MGEQLQWPDLGSFKEMLRDESLMRIGVMGPWIVPGVRAENQLRIYLYKWWLKAVDEGIGDPALLEPLPPNPPSPNSMNANTQQQQQQMRSRTSRSSRRSSSSRDRMATRRSSSSSRGRGYDDGFDEFDYFDEEEDASYDARGQRFERF